MKVIEEVRNYFGKYGDIKQLHMPFVSDTFAEYVVSMLNY